MSKFNEWMNTEITTLKETASENNLFIQGKLSEAIRIRAIHNDIIEWIPAETPPDSDRYILLSFDNFSLPAIGRYEVDDDGNGAFYQGDDDRSCVSFGLFVNAWMELPKRYEG